MKKFLLIAFTISVMLNIVFAARWITEARNAPGGLLAGEGLPSLTVTFDGEYYGDMTRASYCWDGVCADTMRAPEIWTERMPIPWNQIPGDFAEFEIVSHEPVDSMTVGIMDEDGGALPCEMDVRQEDSTHFVGTLCDDPGERVIMEFVIYPAAGGDMAFFYPAWFR